MRAGFPYGRHPLRIEESHLDLGEYLEFPRRATRIHRRVPAHSSATPSTRSASAGAPPGSPRRRSWKARPGAEAPALPEDCVAITSPVSGSVWQIKVAAGQAVAKGETLVIMEAMKMEIAVIADSAGTVVSIHGEAGAGARAGDTLLLLRPELP